MKRILICGTNSYIGTSVKDYLARWPEAYSVFETDMENIEWMRRSFEVYDCVILVAAIVHRQEHRTETALFYQVNRDMAYSVARKAKTDRVKHFVFFSSMSVYGRVTGTITRESTATPDTHYGKSKYEAELLINELSDAFFKVAILRPPMIYGPGCKGNYCTLEKIATKLPAFFYVENKRSMLHVDSLTYFVKTLIDEGKAGLFLPQEKNYICTSDMIKEIAIENGRHIVMIKGFGWIIRNIPLNKLKKAFGDLIYSDPDIVDFQDV